MTKLNSSIVRFLTQIAITYDKPDKKHEYKKHMTPLINTAWQSVSLHQMTANMNQPFVNN
jgi:hypothetical protein